LKKDRNLGGKLKEKGLGGRVENKREEQENGDF